MSFPPLQFSRPLDEMFFDVACGFEKENDFYQAAYHACLACIFTRKPELYERSLQLWKRCLPRASETNITRHILGLLEEPGSAMYEEAEKFWQEYRAKLCHVGQQRHEPYIH